MELWFPATIFLAALVDSVNPCAFSVLFLTIAFLFSLSRSRRGILAAGLLYIAGIFTVYVAIGLGVLQALSFFSVPHGVAKVGALIIIVFGLIELLGALIPNFPIKLKIPTAAHPRIAAILNRATLPAMFLLGLAVGMFEFPCTGGPYLLVLGLLHDNATFWSGFFYLLFYNLVFVLPLLVVLFLISNQYVLGRLDEWRKRETKRFSILIALVMIVLGLVIFMI